MTPAITELQAKIDADRADLAQTIQALVGRFDVPARTRAPS